MSTSERLSGAQHPLDDMASSAVVQQYYAKKIWNSPQALSGPTYITLPNPNAYLSIFIGIPFATATTLNPSLSPSLPILSTSLPSLYPSFPIVLSVGSGALTGVAV